MSSINYLAAGKAILSRLQRHFLHYLAPAWCQCCGDFAYSGDDAWLCPTCRDSLHYIHGSLCTQCGTPSFSTSQCPGCEQLPVSHLARVRSLLWLEPQSQRLIHDFKFRSKRPLAKTFARLLLSSAELKTYMTSCQAIVPVPLSYQRLRWRGYNQAHLIAQALAQHLNLPVLPQALHKTHAVAAQSSLNRQARLHNLDHSIIAAPELLVGIDKILLIDDVLTTGATLLACAQALKICYPKLTIHAVSLARTPLTRD